DGKTAVYWVNHAWLYCWLTYGIYSLGGGAGLVIFKAIVFTVAIAVLSRVGWRSSSRWFVLLCLIMAALAASMRALVQPTAVSMLFVAITLYVLDRVGLFGFKQAKTPEEARGETRWLWCLPPLFALWANLDAWFILGPMLVALCWAAVGLTKW